MSIAELKENFHRIIDETQDSGILESYYNMMKAESQKDFWDELTPEQQQNVIEAKRQCENGETVEHEEVMKKISEWIIK